VIVRILGEGQYDVPDAETAALEDLDRKLSVAIEADDEKGFEEVLAELVQKVRSSGAEVGPETIVPSSLTLPHASSSLAETKALLASEESGES